MNHSGQLSELDELRRQVADLSRELAKQNRASCEQQGQPDSEILRLQKQAEMLRAIIKETSAVTGNDVARVLVRQVAEVLNVRCVFVGEWHEDRPDHVRTLAAWIGTWYAEPFDYCLNGTPCKNVFERRMCLYESGVQRLFPDDRLLVEMKVESYCGVRLSDHLGRPLGVLVVMDEKPMGDIAFIEDLVGVVAGRMASEVERSRAENERLRSWDLLKNVMETVPDIIFRLNLHGHLVGWNKRLELVTGLSPEELNNRPAFAFVPEAEHAKTAAAIQRAFHEGYAELEGHLLTSAGRFIPYHWTGAVLKDHEGRVIGITGVGRDISERKQMQLELEQALGMLKLTQFSVDHAVDGFLWIGPDANILKANQAASRLLEYSQEELMSMTVHDIDANLPPESWSSRWMEWKARGSWTYETKYWSPNGRVVDAEVTVNYLSYEEHEYCCAILRDIGDRKRADAAVRANEERLDLVLRATNDGVWDWNILTGEEYLSPQWKALLGFTGQELPSNENSFFQRLHPDDVDQVKAALEAHFQQRSPYDLEVRLRHREGYYQWFRARGEAIRDTEGRPYRMVGSIIDIAERKRVDEALHESEERFSKAFHEAAIGMALISPEGRWLQVNQALCAILGYSEAELMAMTVRAVTHHGDMFANSRFMEGVLSGELRTFHLETRYFHKQGHVVWVILSTSLIKNVDGSPRYLILQIQNISERRLAETAVRESEAMHRALFDQSPLMCFLLDAEGTVLKVNRLGAETLGYDVSELLSRSVFTVFPEDARTLARQYVAECVAGPKDALHSWELPKQRKDGSRLWVREFARLITDQEGRPTVLISCEDMTDRKHTEDALRLTQYAVDQADDQIFLIGDDGYILSVNESACRRLGYTKQELLTMSVMDIDPDFPSEVWDSFWNKFKMNKRVRLETRHRGKSGEIYPVEVTANYFLHNGRELDYAIVRDITERKRSADELQRSHAFIRQVIDTDPNFVFAKDRDGRYRLVNKAAAAIYGTTPADMVGKTDADFNPDYEQVEFFRKKDLAVLNSCQELFIPEEVITDSSGTTRWLQTVKRPILDEHGIPVMVLGVASDITQRKQIEEALRESLERFDLAVTASQDGLWDAQIFADNPFNPHNPIYYSPRMKEIMGVEQGPETDVIGAWANLVHPDDRDRIFTTLTAHLTQKVPYDIEYRIVRPDGDIRWIAARGQAQWNVDGRPIRMSGSFADITQRKQAEELLRQRERDLQTALDERERISQDLHDGILQSLYATGLMLESCKPLFVQPRNTSSASPDRMTVFNQSIGQLNQVMSEIRNFIAGLESQILQGVDFSTAIRSMVHSMAVAGISCRVTIDESAVSRISTEQAFHLVNLTREALSNSVRHSRATQILVSLARNSGSVRLSVSDNGIGFDSDKVHGSGHGLINMAARARKIGGQLTVRSRPRHGTSIVVEIQEESAHAPYDA